MSCYRIVRKQFPLIAAEALTIHKSQGDTYECVIVHIERFMRRNALYTALSRAKTASGLFIVGNLKLSNKISEKDPVLRELKRLKQMCSIIWSIEFTSPTIYFHNIRSLQKLCEDLVSDSIIVHSEILILQETMTTPNDTFTIPGHSLVCRVDGKARTPGSGKHIYSRNSVICHTKLAHTSSHSTGNIETTVIEYFDPCITQETVTLVSVYRSPRIPLQYLISNLDEILSKIHLSPHCVIIGDFNVDGISRERFLRYSTSSLIRTVLFH